MTYARITNHQRRQTLKPITFQTVNWQPQIQVTFTRDVNGWLDRTNQIKWSFRTGQTVMIDAEHALEFIIKGYCTGQLPRPVSDNEQAEIRSNMTIIGMGPSQPQTRNGGDPTG